MAAATSRVVILIDMDCFYCQVEEKLDPDLEGKPIAVVQYKAWRGGGIIAVNYPARNQGVTRYMRGNDAKEKCPSINLVRVPELRGKADLTKYRDAGKRVADVLATFTPLLARASVDEAYLDVTELVKTRIENDLSSLCKEKMQNTFVVGQSTEDFIENSINNRHFAEHDLNLAVGGLIAEEIRQEVYNKTGYRCSAGIAHNKILAKLVCGLHKPNKQTILPQDGIPELFATLPVGKVTGFGGKFGQSLVDNLGIQFMGQLAQFTEKQLLQKYDEKTANWLYNIARGIDLEPVTAKLISKSIACCKNFPGKTALFTSENVQHWFNELAEELSERLNKDLKENKRKAKQIIVNFTQEIDGRDVSSSRTVPLVSYASTKISQSAFGVVTKHCLKPDGSFHLTHLGISAGHFEDLKNVREITSFFKLSENRMSDLKECTTGDSVNQTGNEIVEENVYLQTTQPLNENPNDLVFYNEEYRVKSLNNVHGELPKTPAQNRKPTDDGPSPSCSFFRKYFNEVKPIEIFEAGDSCDDEDAIENYPITENFTELCQECMKQIPISELISHQDYHFAVKLMQSDRQEQRKISPTYPGNGKKIISKGKKRKSDELGNNKVLMTFIKQNELADTDEVETCSICQRKVKIEEIASHLDYHAAKKLHLELNSVKPILNKTTKNKKQTKTEVSKNLTAFFKPL